MGKPTKGQLRAVDSVVPPRVKREGVTVRYAVAKDGSQRDDLVLDGDYEAQLTPGGAVAFIEMVPDLLNQNQGKAVPIARRFINTDEWAEVILR